MLHTLLTPVVHVELWCDKIWMPDFLANLIFLIICFVSPPCLLTCFHHLPLTHPHSFLLNNTKASSSIQISHFSQFPFLNPPNTILLHSHIHQPINTSMTFRPVKRAPHVVYMQVEVGIFLFSIFSSPPLCSAGGGGDGGVARRVVFRKKIFHVTAGGLNEMQFPPAPQTSEWTISWGCSSSIILPPLPSPLTSLYFIFHLFSCHFIPIVPRLVIVCLSAGSEAQYVGPSTIILCHISFPRMTSLSLPFGHCHKFPIATICLFGYLMDSESD